MAGSLELIKKTTVSTSTTSLDITDVFTDKYDVYKITISGLSTATATTGQYNIRFINSSGTTISTNDYDYAALQLRASASFEQKQATASARISFLVRAYQDPKGGAITMYVFNPTNTGSYTFCSWQSAGMVNLNLNGAQKGIGVLQLTDDITGFHIFENGGNNFDSAIFTVYGVK